MENNTTKSTGKLKALFIIPSVIGILIFMIPMKIGGSWTILVKVVSDWLKDSVVGYDNVALIALAILTISAVMALLSLAKPKFIMDNDLLKGCFAVSPFWAIIRVVGCVCVAHVPLRRLRRRS